MNSKKTEKKYIEVENDTFNVLEEFRKRYNENVSGISHDTIINVLLNQELERLGSKKGGNEE